MKFSELDKPMVCKCEHGCLYHEIKMYADCIDILECYFTDCDCKEFVYDSVQPLQYLKRGSHN